MRSTFEYCMITKFNLLYLYKLIIRFLFFLLRSVRYAQPNALARIISIMFFISSKMNIYFDHLDFGWSEDLHILLSPSAVLHSLNVFDICKPIGLLVVFSVHFLCFSLLYSYQFRACRSHFTLDMCC